MPPVRELPEVGKPAEALEEFEASLTLYPARFNGPHGVGLAVERAGCEGAARKSSRQLLHMTKDGRGLSPELVPARSFVEGS